ncbi:MAG: ACT domain-containing protein, partial [Dorea sp.]
NIVGMGDIDRGRLIDAEWEGAATDKGDGQYLAEIKMYAQDKQGFLMEMSKVFTETNVDVKSMNVRTSKQGVATIETGFIVHGKDELARVMKKLRQLEGVIDIERV